MRPNIQKNVKKFSGCIETIPITTHNPVLGPTLEMTVFGGGIARTLRRGPGATGEPENKKTFKIFDGHIKMIPLMPHNPGLWFDSGNDRFGGSWDPSEGSWGDW